MGYLKFSIAIIALMFFVAESSISQDFVFNIGNKVIPVSIVKKEEVVPEEDNTIKEIEKRADEIIASKTRRRRNVKILFVGDSMVEAIYKPSKSICKRKRYKCDYIFKRGLRTDAWTRSGWYGVNLILKISENKPDIVVISSGTNDIYAKESKEQIYRDFLATIRLIRDVSKNVNINPKIIIVAPPIPNDKNLNEYLKKKFRRYKNVYVMQSKYYRFKLWDGIHPTAKSSSIWANKIIKMIDRIKK